MIRVKVFLNKPKNCVDAFGEFNKKTRELIVLKGSRVSEKVTYTEKFRGSKSIEKQRVGRIQDNILQEDVKFKSPSTAGNFVTGKSTNGLTAWKDKNGKTIKELLNEG